MTTGEPLLKAVEYFINEWTEKLIAKDFDAWIGHWSADAMLIRPGVPPFTGRDAILAQAENLPSASAFSFSDWSVEAAGNLAVVTNTLKWGDQNFNQVIVLRNEDGAWKVRIAMFNSADAGQS